eukprot:Protomagalhaensia_sp_Gyna_25__2845@NODE_2653_length_963_cov_9_455628_g2212_i0_p1_GENE_NODE_2653_length_963_cov_9_455628_g2212_i0NODE_2653_length_963_cov_9_455628_g2212_i0_p1_ORF_typecomplete_len178_score16_39_NODE_2653_length_963_cov_9_455628_g2212_i0360893
MSTGSLWRGTATESFAGRLRISLPIEWQRLMPLRLSAVPSGVLLQSPDGDGTLHCLLSPAHLDTLLTRGRAAGVESLGVREQLAVAGSGISPGEMVAILVARATALSPNGGSGTATPALTGAGSTPQRAADLSTTTGAVPQVCSAESWTPLDCHTPPEKRDTPPTQVLWPAKSLGQL